MATVKEYLIAHREEISCTRCGRCCDDRCSAKKTAEDGSTLCEKHPTINGYEMGSREDMIIRSKYCKYYPVDLAIRLKVACPPVIEVIQQLTGLRLEGRDPFGYGVFFFIGEEDMFHIKMSDFQEALEMPINE